MPWDEFWAVYADADHETQREMIDQVDLVKTIKRVSLKTRREILRAAPDSIIQALKIATGLN